MGEAFPLPGFTGVFDIVWWVLLGLKALIWLDVLRRSPRVFLAADRLTKPGWLVLMGTFILAQLVISPISVIGLLGLVATVVYMVDTFGALNEAAGKGGGGWRIRRRRGPRPL